MHLKSAALIASFLFIVGACGGTAAPGQSASPASGTPGGGSAGTPAATAGGGGGGATTGGDCIKPGTNTANGSVEGSVVTTGAYAATWAFVVGNNGIAISIGGGSSRIGLTADDNGPEADLHVDTAGTIEFGGILPGPKGETLPPNVGQIFNGSGAQVTFCKPTDETTPSYLCAVTLDNDVIGSTDSSAMLHLKGTLTIKGTMPTTLGVTITC